MSEKPAGYDHLGTMNAIVNLFRSFAMTSVIVTTAEAEFARDTLELADTLGPMIDPTAYRTALNKGTIDQQKKLVKLFLKNRAELIELFPEAGILLR